MNLSRVQSWLAQATPGTRTLLRTVIYGLAAGASAVVFHMGVHFLYAHGIERLANNGSMATFLVGSFLIIAVTSGFSGWLLSSYCPEAAGSGIPQLKVAFWRDFGVMKLRVVWVKLLGGILTVGGGASLGREGPTVQLGGALASNLAGWLGEPAHRRRAASAAGAAAGLAAAFNTPIAAVTFVLEEIIGDLNSRLLGGVLFASVLGALVAHAFLGEQPAFQLHPVGHVSWTGYLAVPVVAVIASAVGAYFQRTALSVRKWNKKPHRLPPWLRTMMGGLAVWIIGSAVFLSTGRLGVFSLGYEDLSASLSGSLPATTAGILLIAKLAATILCYGLGGCGGIFAPTLFFGATTGAAAAGVLSLIVPVDLATVVLLAVVGMCSCLAAVVRAPVTSILIVFEMTHEFAVVPPLMLAVLISQWVTRKFCRENFYDALIRQDGIEIEQTMPPRDLRAWQAAPVSRIANFRPVLIDDLSPERIDDVLQRVSYDRFPVVANDGRLLGVLTRSEALAAQQTGRKPTLIPGQTVRRDASIRDVQRKLIESSQGIVFIQAGSDERVVGLVTLHDILRAEANLAES
ncbi:MAG TPA: chloride channel protein [Opitutaceae bacterium]|nr:chloride channel protein [Opitutaceae bacterium]